MISNKRLIVEHVEVDMKFVFIWFLWKGCNVFCLVFKVRGCMIFGIRLGGAFKLSDKLEG